MFAFFCTGRPADIDLFISFVSCSSSSSRLLLFLVILVLWLVYLHFVKMDGSREICLFFFFFVLNQLRRAELMIQTLSRAHGRALCWKGSATVSGYAWRMELGGRRLWRGPSCKCLPGVFCCASTQKAADLILDHHESLGWDFLSL